MRRNDVLIALRRLLRRAERNARRALPLFALIACALAALYGGARLSRHYTPRRRPTSGLLEVTVLNVGQGEASIVKTPDGHFAVIGTGPPGQGNRVVAALRDAGATRVDLLFLPYPYAEAIGGTGELLAALPVGAVIESGGPVINHWEEQLRADCAARHILLRAGHAGEVLPFGAARWTILAPDTVRVPDTPTAANNSLVLRLQYGQTAFLWAGGLDRAGEAALLARTPDLAADWLRVARFGTANAGSAEFLRLVSPSDAVISVGANTGGYPSQDTLTHLQATGATIYRTDAAPDGLLFTSDGVSVFSPPAS